MKAIRDAKVSINTLSARYRRLKAAVGKTPLRKLEHLSIANNNRIFAKLEYQNPGGSHYDRIYVKMFQSLEREGKIKPGVTRLVETTTGNAGASFAWVASQLGYDCTVIIPADVATSRKRQILDRGAQLIESPAGEYVRGAIKCLHRFLIENKGYYKSGEIYCLNHSKDPLSVIAVESLADEIRNDLALLKLEPDYLILGCGNGTTILGVGRRLKVISPGSECIAFDPLEAPVAFERKYPGRYEHEFGVQPESLPHQHRILGTGGWGVQFPHIDNPDFLSVVDEVYLVKDEEMSQAQEQLAEKEHLYPGRSSAAALAVALRLAEVVHNRSIVLLFYDELNFYPDPNNPLY